MQRRAAAVYAVVFLLVGTASYALIATAERPHVQFDDPAHELSQGGSFAVDGRSYTVTEVTAEAAGGGGVTRSGAVRWTNQSARYTETWEHNSTVTVDGTDYAVVAETEAVDPSAFALRETQNRSAILAADPAADNETVTRGGQEFVVVTENGTARLVPAADYFPAPPETEYAEGDRVAYRGNRTTVETVTNQSVTLAWQAPRTNTVQLSNEANVTLSGQRFFVYFPDNSTVQLVDDYGSYERQTAEIEQFTTHRSGLWGVTFVSGAAVVFLLAMAYLPSRY